MKNLNLLTATLSSLFLAAPALAVVASPGDFTPRECSPVQVVGQAADPLTQMCIGQIATTEKQGQEGVSFRLQSGAVKTFAVESRFNLANAFDDGATQVVLHLQAADGQRASLNELLGHDGSLITVSGGVANQRYTAHAFEPVMVMQ